MSIPATEPEILADLARVFADFQGREYSGPVDGTTRFFADLGLASIDAVVLGETLQERYGRPLRFELLLAELGRREDRDLTVGELAAFLMTQLKDSPPAEGPPHA